MERMQVRVLLAGPVEDRRNTELLRNGHEDATLRGRVVLGEDNPVDRYRLAEDLGLLESVLPGSRIDHEQSPVDGVRRTATDDTIDLGELFHEVFPGMHTAGRIGEDETVATRARALNRVEYDSTRIRTRGLFDDAHAETFGVNGELLYCGRAKGVACREADRLGLPGLAKVRREFGDRRRL